MNPTVSHLFNSLPSGNVKVSSFYSYAGFLIMCKGVLMYYTNFLTPSIPN